MKNTLKEILNAFQGVNGNEELLLNEFKKLACHFLFGGYFQVNDRKIYLRDIEFYYHEENERAKIKDYIMYHISDKIKDSKKKNEYYPLGAFNAHVSGVDFTFENKAKQYRASILIRSVKIVDKASEPVIEARPTYVYEYLLMGKTLLGDGLIVKWIDEELPVEPMLQKFRKNVCQYDHLGIRIEYQNDSKNKPVIIGRRKYCQCTREWRFGVGK